MRNILSCMLGLACVISNATLAQEVKYADLQEAAAAYRSCIDERTARFASVCEPIEHLATAAVGGCQVELRNLQSVGIRLFGPERSAELVLHYQDAWRAEAITKFIEHRAEHPCSIGGNSP